MSDLLLEGLSKHYGESVAVECVDVAVTQGELVALLGPSGCGKTTTLRMVAGFIAPTTGRVLIGGTDVTALPPYRRDTGMVFQSYALFPHMTVAENVAFGLEMRKVGREERTRRAHDSLRLVRLDHLANRLPRQLSGGQQQRVALARALAINPAVFLLDEPLSNLDAKLRAEVRHEIRSLQRRLGLTTLIVTHDQEEAMTMADRLVVMERGRVCQVGTPKELYERPANAFVAGFVGRCNLIEGTVVSTGRFRTPGGAELPCRPDPAMIGPAQLALRPERISLGATREIAFEARVEAVSYLGASTEYRLRLSDVGLVAVIPTPAPGDRLHVLGPGDLIPVGWDIRSAALLPSTATAQ